MITALDIEVAIIRFFGPRENIVVPNVSWGMWSRGSGILHECDILSLTKAGWATEVEIKVSRADIRKDAEKWHGHDHELIRRLYFAVPVELEAFALENIPERAGLIVVEPRPPYIHRTRVIIVRESKINPNAVKWTKEQRFQLARLGALRILKLKEKILRFKVAEECAIPQAVLEFCDL